MDALTLNSPPVLAYLTTLQGVISRMASNSASAKTWCVGLVSAIAVVVADKGKPDYVWIALGPVALFFFLDSYYLGLERLCRNRYNQLVRKLHAGEAIVEDVFVLEPGTTATILRSAAKATGSPSVWPFYSLFAVMLLLIRCWIL